MKDLSKTSVKELNTVFRNGKFPQRGEIYYISSGNTGSTGCEQWSNRFGVIVSSDFENRKVSTVQIVYLTTKAKPNYRTYVDVSLPWLHRVALCNQIMSVDISRLEDYKCYLDNANMKKIDCAIMRGLGLHTSENDEQRKGN